MVFARKTSALPKARDDAGAVWQPGQVVASLRMGLHRQDLAVDTERADAVADAELQRSQEGVGVGAAQLREVRPPLFRGQAQHRSHGRGAKFDRLSNKLAA